MKSAMLHSLRSNLLLSVVVLTTPLISAVAQDSNVATNRAAIYHAGWIDFNKNGQRDIFEDPSQPVDKRVEDLLSQMTVEEKTCQLATLYGFTRVLKDPLPTADWKNQIWKDGVANIDEMHNGIGGGARILTIAEDPVLASPAETVKALNEVQRWFVEETRLGIPAEFTDEGIRGLNNRNSVNFPADIALGASWDRDLITTIGKVVASEAKAMGYRNVYAPILDLARDPRWGRVVETYGEDPYLVGELGLCMTRALQKNGIVSTAKHFAVYSEPKGGRDGLARTDPHVAPREMEMVHLRPWERDVREGGLLGAMSSYNDYDGVPISGNSDFLIERLRHQWGFRGYVVSDSDAVEFLYTKHHVAANADDAAAMFLREGGNVRTTFTLPDQFILPIRREIVAGKLPMDVVNDRVRDVLRVKFIEGLFDQPYVDPTKANAAIGSAENKAVALRAARESLVLLKNEKQTLPLSKNLKHILVCGPTARMKETSYDRYGANGGQVVSVLEGIEALLKNSGTKVDFAQGCKVTDRHWPESELFPEPPSGDELKQIQDAVEQAKLADAIILCLGDSNATIGESKSRTSLDLPGFQTDLAKALMKTGRPVVVVLLNGKPASINWITRYCPAILEAWIPGEAGGTAVAEALFGDYNPGGKLSVTFPKTVGQIPFNFPFKPGSQASQNKKADANGFGDSMAEGALYPFGYGLSYTKFEYSNLKILPAEIPPDGEVTVTFEVKNVGDRAGDEVAQLYFHQTASSVTTYVLNLCGFARVNLQPGEMKTLTMTIHPRELEIINREGQRVVEPGNFEVHVGASSEDLRLKGQFEVTGNILHPPQSAMNGSRMMYADSTRRGKPWSKNPFVLKFGGRYLMYTSILPVPGSEAREIEITASQDLIHWKNVGVIRAQESYEKNGISAPCAVVKDGKVHLFYQTYRNGTNDAICHAVSDDGITNFQRDSSNPIFRPDGAWNCGRAIDAEVFFHDGKYLMYYATRDPSYKTQMLGVASASANTSFSRDEWTHLSKAGPILKPELPWEGECIEAPSIIERNGQLFMFYAGSYDNTPQQISVATSKDGITWTRLFAEPFLRNGQPGEWNSSESGHCDIFDDGDRSFLFFQGNPDKGKTWWISNLEVFWNERGPFLKTKTQSGNLNLKSLRNPVWTSKDNLRDPSVLKTADGYRIFYSRFSNGAWNNPTNWAIASVFTKDFVRFESDCDVSPKGFASPGDVVFWHGRWLLPYQSYPASPVRLCFSESLDLTNWSAPGVFLEQVAALPWNTARRVIDPTFVVDGETLHCFFIGSGFRTNQSGKTIRGNLMGHAITRDPKLEKWRILTPDAPLIGFSESAPDGVENTMIFRTGEHWTMIYSEGLEDQHLALATSPDLMSWKLEGPIEITRQKWMSRKYGASYVWQDGNQWLMILMGTDDKDHTTFGLLTSSDGRQWKILQEQ